MNITEMTDYEMGQMDFKEGLDPIQDFDLNSPSDVEYMRGYEDARNDQFWDDVYLMSKCDPQE